MKYNIAGTRGFQILKLKICTWTQLVSSQCALTQPLFLLPSYNLQATNQNNGQYIHIAYPQSFSQSVQAFNQMVCCIFVQLHPGKAKMNGHDELDVQIIYPKIDKLKMMYWSFIAFTLATNSFHREFLHDIWTWISSKNFRCYSY